MKFEQWAVAVCSFCAGFLLCTGIFSMFVADRMQEANRKMWDIVQKQSCALVWSEPRLKWLYPEWDGWFVEDGTPIISNAQYKKCRESAEAMN